MQDKLKEDKQKVTLYLPQELHRQLKIRAAVDSETMTEIAQKAIVFYLSHPDLVEQYSEGYGHSHRVYNCPECSTSVVLREGEMMSAKARLSVKARSGVLVDDDFAVENPQPVGVESQGEGELVPC
ncbi:MAG: hypothetical protein IGS48_06545 [Oscillatoriales cyanobacterium C42_A2020_001]|nr:hypothetical protein [Leptolyngbyaceae cyanobacterium C42_A2020_001]